MVITFLAVKVPLSSLLQDTVITGVVTNAQKTICSKASHCKVLCLPLGQVLIID